MLFLDFKAELGVREEDGNTEGTWDQYHVVVEDRSQQRFLPVDGIEFDDRNDLVILHV